MKRFRITYREHYQCNACVNGFVMTAFGPKPCPQCAGTGIISEDTEYDVNEEELVACNFNSQQVISFQEYDDNY